MNSESQNRWRDRYESGDLPWDTKRADKDLIRIVESIPVKPCRALDLGCGLGTNAIWLAQQGFSTCGVDIAPNAIEGAKTRAAESGTAVQFICADITQDSVGASNFEFTFDRGCFHSMPGPHERTAFARSVHAATARDALWFSTIGNADDDFKKGGPPRLTLQEVVLAVEPYFRIQSIEARRFDTDSEHIPLGWMMTARRREI